MFVLFLSKQYACSWCWWGKFFVSLLKRGWHPKSRLGRLCPMAASGRCSIFYSRVLSYGSSLRGLCNIPVVVPLLLVTYVPGTVLMIPWWRLTRGDPEQGTVLSVIKGKDRVLWEYQKHTEHGWKRLGRVSRIWILWGFTKVFLRSYPSFWLPSEERVVWILRSSQSLRNLLELKIPSPHLLNESLARRPHHPCPRSPPSDSGEVWSSRTTYPSCGY